MHPEPGPSRGRTSVALILLMLLSVWLPVPVANAAIQIENRDLGVLTDLHEALDVRGGLLVDDGESASAETAMASVDAAIRSSGPYDPLALADNPMSDATFKQIDIQPVDHPDPYDLILDPDSAPPGATDSILNTLINITDYVVWTHYEANDGRVVDKFEVIDFSQSLTSLLFSPEPFEHEIDIDDLLDDGSTPTLIDTNGDGIPDSLNQPGNCGYDVSVGLTVSIDPDDGAGIEGTTLWLEPTIEFSVEMFDGQVDLFDLGCAGTPSSDTDDPVWNSMGTLRVSLFKQFTYSESLFFGSEGPSYIWVIDTLHTIPPEDTSVEVGLERVWFDIADSALSGINGLTLGLLGTLAGIDLSGIQLVSISSPYAIHLETLGSTLCPDSYDPSTDASDNPVEHGCGTLAGFGYIHLSEPTNGVRSLIELAYIEFSAHPRDLDNKIPSEVDIVIRSDSVLSTTVADVGEGSLTSIEYYSDRRADVHVHFHEDRRNKAPSQLGQSFGNVTESSGWLRGMPEGSLNQLEIDRIFTMLGSNKAPELPGQIPSRLGLIIALKNFSKDVTQNDNDPSLPVNPADPPQSLVLIRSVQPVDEIDYGSWFLREGSEEDRRQIRTRMNQLPTALVLYGSFSINNGDDGTNVSLDSSENLDFFSRILDTTILNLVDIFIGIGGALNAVPEALGEAISGGMTSGSSLSGNDFHLQMFDDIGVNRIPMVLGEIEMDLGTTDHPTLAGDHILLSEDRDLDLVQGRSGSREPLLPIALSVRLRGFSAADLADDSSLDRQVIGISTIQNESLRVGFTSHDAGTMENSSIHLVKISSLPDSIEITVLPGSMSWNSSDEIEEIIYIGKDRNHRQAVRMRGIPTSFEMEVAESFSWNASSPMSSVEIQISNHSSPSTMDGDHFLYNYDGPTDTAYLSARITNVSQAAYLVGDTDLDPEALDRVELRVDGSLPFRSSIEHIPALGSPDTRGLHVRTLFDPMPGVIGLDVPRADNIDGPEILIPEFNTSQGLQGLASFMDGMSDLGGSMNRLLADLTESVTGKAGETATSELSLGFELDADRHFDLTVDARQGSLDITPPEWRHGISMTAIDEEEEQGFHIRTWLPGLAPDVKTAISFRNESGLEIWDIEVEMSDWRPAREEFIVEIKGFDGQDLDLALIGFEKDESTEVSVVTSFSTRNLGAVSEVTTSTNYHLSQRLDFVVASILNRNLGTKSQLFVSDIPGLIDLYASIGESISVSLSVPESERVQGDSVKSVMLQQLQWSAGQWWPATVFLKDVPGEIDLTTDPANIFDITKPTSFQGIPEFDFSASSAGMDLYMEITGRAINTRGDTVMLAEDLMDRMTVTLDEDYNLAIRSSGIGIRNLYLRQSNVPIQPGIILEQMEAMGENLKSATISLNYIGKVYPVFRIDDVQGGRILMSSRASVDFMGIEWDGRAVLIDAQQTSGIPTGTSVGVNGIASDLSLLNVMPGFDGSTTHYMVPEPLSTGIVTVCATFLGGD